jgi:hypothetical protein
MNGRRVSGLARRRLAVVKTLVTSESARRRHHQQRWLVTAVRLAATHAGSLSIFFQLVFALCIRLVHFCHYDPLFGACAFAKPGVVLSGAGLTISRSIAFGEPCLQVV